MTAAIPAKPIDQITHKASKAREQWRTDALARRDAVLADLRRLAMRRVHPEAGAWAAPLAPEWDLDPSDHLIRWADGDLRWAADWYLSATVREGVERWIASARAWADSRLK